MGFLSQILKLRSKNKNAKIVVLGPSKAGKTTLVRFLETGEPQTEEPLSTLGIDFRKKPVKFENWTLSLIDVGGQKVYQDAFWNFSIESSDAVIYVVDSTIKPENNDKEFKNQLSQYNYVMSIIPDDLPVLLLLNKQDLLTKNPITPETFLKYYPMDDFNRTLAFMPISAKLGDGLNSAFDWFIDRLNEQ